MKHMSGRYGNAEDWGADMVAGHGGYIKVASTVTLFAVHGTATIVGFATAIRYWCARVVAVVIDF